MIPISEDKGGRAIKYEFHHLDVNQCCFPSADSIKNFKTSLHKHMKKTGKIFILWKIEELYYCVRVA